MIEIYVPERELYDEVNEVFITTKPCILQLEHSLLSVSRWESKWRKSFFANEEKTRAESLDYIRCMTINRNVDSYVYQLLSNKDLDRISEYIDASLTATTFHRYKKAPPNRQIITSELIYSWMVTYNIPFECQKWHLSRLMTLIEILNIQNSPQKKMGKNEILRSNAELNRARRAKLHSKG